MWARLNTYILGCFCAFENFLVKHYTCIRNQLWRMDTKKSKPDVQFVNFLMWLMLAKTMLWSYIHVFSTTLSGNYTASILNIHVHYKTCILMYNNTCTSNKDIYMYVCTINKINMYVYTCTKDITPIEDEIWSWEAPGHCLLR